MKSEVSITLRCQLCSTRYTAFCSESTSTSRALKSTHTKRNSAARPNFSNYCLKSEIPNMLRCRLCLTRYKAIRIKNCLNSTPEIKIATMKNMDDFRFDSKGSHHVLSPNRHLSLSAKMNGTQRRTLVSP